MQHSVPTRKYFPQAVPRAMLSEVVDDSGGEKEQYKSITLKIFTDRVNIQTAGIMVNGDTAEHAVVFDFSTTEWGSVAGNEDNLG